MILQFAKKLSIIGILFLSACTLDNPVPSPSVEPSAPQSASPTTSSCQPTDQDQYVYNPNRLSIQETCIRITGTILAKVQEADGDFHIRVQLDSQYQSLLTPANQNQCAQGICGLLVVEPVCVNLVTQSDAISTCAADLDPLINLPNINDHVWMEGRYVFDTAHGGWAELHPLYRWGLI